MGQFISEVSTRFAPYAEELKACAASRGVPQGSPADLHLFAQQLSRHGRLRSEMSSLVRATIFREQEAIQPEEVVELLVFAIGGPEAEMDRPELGTVQAELRRFVGEIFRGLWARFGDMEAASVASPVPEIALDEPRSKAGPRERSALEEITLQGVPPGDELTPGRTVRAASRPPRSEQPAQKPVPHLHLDLRGMTSDVARDLPRTPAAEPVRETVQEFHEIAPLEQEDAIPPKAGVFTSVRSLWRDPEPEITEEGEYPQYSSLDLQEPERRRYLLLGVGGLLFGAAIGTLIWRHPTPPASAVGVRPTVSAPQAANAGSLESSPPPSSASEEPVPSTETTIGASAGANHSSGRVVTNRDWDHALSMSGRTAVHSAPIVDLAPKSAAHNSVATNAVPAQPLGSGDRAATDDASASVPANPSALSGALPANGSSRVVMNNGSVTLSVAGPMAANLLSAPVPPYPASARAAGVQGAVTVQAVIGLGGDVVATRVLSGPAPLRDAAQTAVHRWRFVPYLVGGRPSMFTTEAVVDFRSTHPGTIR